jgi:hypothetical protein
MSPLPATVNRGHNSRKEICLPFMVPEFVYVYQFIYLRWYHTLQVKFDLLVELCPLFTVAGSGDIHVLWTHSTVFSLSKVQFNPRYFKVEETNDFTWK